MDIAQDNKMFSVPMVLIFLSPAIFTEKKKS